MVHKFSSSKTFAPPERSWWRTVERRWFEWNRARNNRPQNDLALANELEAEQQTSLLIEGPNERPMSRPIEKPPPHPEEPEIRPIFAQLSATGTDIPLDTAWIAERAVTTWQHIAATLTPIIGSAGFNALYKRSLYLTRGDYPWLLAAQEDNGLPGSFATFGIVLTQQTAEQSAAANQALLKNFCEFLISLIGASLTRRLLQPVADQTSSPSQTTQQPPP